MEVEIEAKFPGVDPMDVRKKLHSAGAVCLQPEVLMRRKVFDYPDLRLEKIGGWIRVRDEGNRVTMSYKQLNNRTLHGTKEVTLVVDSFDKGVRFLDLRRYVRKIVSGNQARIMAVGRRRSGD